jgi:hypothetical protein
MKLAKQCEDKADLLYPCDENLAEHSRLMARAENLRAIANNIASTYLKSRKV